jgi:hypothetical protein
MGAASTRTPALVAGFVLIAVVRGPLAQAQGPGLWNLAPRLDAGVPGRPPIQVQVEGSHTFGGRTDYRGLDGSRSEAWTSGLGFFAPVPLSESWIVPLGLGSQNVWLEEVPGMPIPERINTLSFTTGLGHRWNDEWMVMGMFNTLLYRVDGVGRRDVGFAGGLNALWQARPTLAFRFGFMVAPDSDLPVLPLVGVDWRFQEQWELRLMLPQPRLIYQPAERWRLHVGASLVDTLFRTTEGLGDALDNPEYRGALGTYRDIRVGGGVGYQWGSAVSVEFEAGYSVSRRLEYPQLDERVSFAPAPYVRLALRLGF